MRSITKAAEPVELRNWKQSMQNTPQNMTYGNLPGDVRDEIKKHLLREQGYLCAYTMLRLEDVGDCHIEHVQPQNAAPALDLDYANMAACFPWNGGDTSHGYGAPVKAGQVVVFNGNFVSPHSNNCENRFVYDADGGVRACDGDNAARQTIEILELDHSTLAELRRSAIEAHGLSLRRKSTRSARNLKSAAEARRFAAEVMQSRNGGELQPFCVALSQVAIEYAVKEEARAQRMRAQRS